jgi:ribose transport system ATP-binding protein
MSGAGASLPRRSTEGRHAFDKGQAMDNGAIEFRGTGLSKSFGGVPVLSDIDLEIARNQIIGIVGENGAGKTTLFNIMSGIVAPDAGTMTFRGNPYSPQRYSDATALGISRVFQEQALIPNILVYENLLLSHERSFARWGQWVEKKRMIDTAQQVIDQAGLDIDVRRRTSTYSFSKRQLIEIARACIVPTEILGIEHPVVLLDEPTSALEKSDEENFRKLITRLRERASIIFVSHRLTEVLELSDAIYVLKDGRLVAEVDPAEADERTLHGLMVGREREADYYHEGSQRDVGEAPVSFKVRNLTRGGEYDDVSLDVRRGEVIGLGGLLNSGKSEFGKGAAGIVPPDSGTVALAGVDPVLPVIRELTKHGLGYVPSERLLEGLISAYTAAWNVSLAGGLDKFSNRFGLWRRQHEIDVTESYIESLSIKANGAQDICATLSGGNQQKVVLARWLCRDPKVLILDNPTRGVDAGAKEEIYELIRRLSTDGVGFLLITDDLLELIGLSNRVVIMQHGKIAKIVDASMNAKPTERELIEAMLAQPPPTDPASANEELAIPS